MEAMEVMAATAARMLPTVITAVAISMPAAPALTAAPITAGQENDTCGFADESSE
jgi:hypothetical protein